LTHTKIKNHSKVFWEYLESIMPGAKLYDKKMNNYNLLYW